MSRLRVLLVEDDPDDADLVVREIERAGYEVESERVEDEAGLRAALARREWDVVVADHSMPRFSGLAALRVLQDLALELPFVIVSGSIPEDLAVAAMKAGAHDFVTKGRLARLVPAVEREIREAAERSRRRDAERRLQEGEARYRRFFEDDLTGDVLASADGRILDCNPAFLSIFGFGSRGEAFGARLFELWATRAEFEALLERVRAEGTVAGLEAELRRRDGRRVMVVANVVGERDGPGPLEGLRAYFFDVTRQREAEEQLRHAQKMEAVGRLAGGIAHDFNNLLCAMTGYADLALVDASLSPTSRRHVAEIRKAAERATMLTRRLLAFSRKQVVQPEVLDVGAVLSDLETMLRRLIREDVALRMDLSPRAGLVRADRGHVEQVVMNLVVNARDAIDATGSIRVATRVVGDGGPPPPDPDVPRGAWLLLSVQDDGSGMTDEVRSHLFEPFFTTKPEGQGTGLGLATVHGIVQQTGGHVRVSTTLGAGTTFRVYWPVVGGGATVAAPSRAAASPRDGTETVLVAEDNAMVRAVVAETLRRRGYAVIEAADGREAIERAEAHAGPIHALVSDVVMPHVPGPDVARRLRERRPGLRVMFLSAYAGELTDDLDAGMLDATFLAKPFRLDEFLLRLQEMLRGEPVDGQGP